MIFDLPGFKSLVDLAVNEDLLLGDITSEMLIKSDQISQGEILAKQDLVLAGQEAAKYVFAAIDSRIDYECCFHDSSHVKSGTIIARINGPTRSILGGERIAVNFLQRLSGIATATFLACERIKGTECRILDTRKTIPGWRVLEKYAVRQGGGSNHRMSLGDGILIKDNHIKAVNGVRNAVQEAQRYRRHPLKIQIEVTSFTEADDAANMGADALLLDNMPVELVREITEKLGRNLIIEASGRMVLENIKEYAQTGINFISMGSITHSAPAVDISLDLS